jgi:hypothetical protein
MMPQSAFAELLARLGAHRGAAIVVGNDELSRWPAAEVAALKSQGLLLKARPAASAVCPGCEHACTMPVHTIRRAGGATTAFIVCDKRSDINRVPLSSAQLSQWRCDAEAVCAFIATSLSLRRSGCHSDDPALRSIGVARGDKRSQMLCLRAGDDVAVVAANNAIPLPELIGFRDGAYSIDAAMIRDLVDSATTADPRYTPSNARREARKLDTCAMYDAWRKAYRDLKRRRRNMSDVWYAQQIAKLELGPRRSAETIRKHMKR